MAISTAASCLTYGTRVEIPPYDFRDNVKSVTVFSPPLLIPHKLQNFWFMTVRGSLQAVSGGIILNFK